MTRRGAYRAGQPGLTLRTLGERIRAIRKAWGWTQHELAKRLHVPQGSVSQWECDKTKPIGPVLAHLLQLFNLNDEALMAGIDFTIPGLLPEAQEQGIRCRTTQADADDMLVLPVATSGEVWRVEISDALPKSKRLSLQQATRYLKEVIQSGGTAWIVASPPKSDPSD